MQSAARGYAGEAFGAAAAAASVVVLIYIARTFHQQGEESRLMREVAKNQHETTRRVAEAAVREQHQRLIQMALDDPLLMTVWPGYGPGISDELRKQFMYANLIISFEWMCWELGYFDDNEVENQLHNLFSSAKIREFWERSRAARDRSTPHTGGMRQFYDVAELAYQSQILHLATRSETDDLAEPR